MQPSTRIPIRCSPDCPYPDCVIAWWEQPPQSGPSESSQTDKDLDTLQEAFERLRNELNNKENQKDEPRDNQPTTSDYDTDTGDKQQQQPQTAQQTQSSSGGNGRQGENGQRPIDRDNKSSDTRPAKEKSDSSVRSQPSKQKPSQVSPLPQIDYKPVFAGETTTSTGFGTVFSQGGQKHTPKVIRDQVFYAKLRNVMKDNAYDRWVKGRKRGDLDMKHLYKVPARSETVFRQKIARKNKKYNIVLLVDQSGSMSGGKIETAASTAIFLARALRAINIDFAIVGFETQIRVYKKFNQSMSDKDLTTLEAKIVHDGHGGTHDYQGLARAYELLKKQHEGKNLIIHLSDGDPGCSGDCGRLRTDDPAYYQVTIDNQYGGEKEFLKITEHCRHNTVAGIKRLIEANKHQAEVVGIGINYVPPQIPNGFRIDKLEEVKPKILAEINKRIKRG